MKEGRLEHNPMHAPVAAVSVGIVPAEGSGSPTAMLDLPYHEDSRAVVDFNVIMRHDAAGPGLVEVQGTGEDGTFSRPQLNEMLDLAEKGIGELVKVQMAAIEAYG